MKFAVGQRVEVLYNPPTPDPSVPGQVGPWTDNKGKRRKAAPGEGLYKTKPDPGEILEARESDNGHTYLVAVELSQPYERNGKKHVAKSVRQRVIPEAKLRAVS